MEIKESKSRVLIVDDDLLNCDIIREFLSSDELLIDDVQSAEEGWERLTQAPTKYDVVLLDRKMPSVDGLELIKRIKSHAKLRFIPVVFQTAMQSKEEAAEGITAGAYYYLTKPYSQAELRFIVQTALGDSRYYKQQQSHLHQSVSSRSKPKKITFRTLDEAMDVASDLAKLTCSPDESVVGLSEILINAVEHGNLGIGYDEKTELIKKDCWRREVERRLALDEYQHLKVEVEYVTDETHVTIRIKDQGVGFHWQDYLELSPQRLQDNHGRGIAIAKALVFDSIEYLGCGNEVVIKIKKILEPDPSSV